MLLAALPFALSTSAADVEEIATAADLKALMDSTDATVLGKGYKLTADIDLSAVFSAQTAPVPLPRYSKQQETTGKNSPVVSVIHQIVYALQMMGDIGTARVL